MFGTSDDKSGLKRWILGDGIEEPSGDIVAPQLLGYLTNKTCAFWQLDSYTSVWLFRWIVHAARDDIAKRTMIGMLWLDSCEARRKELGPAALN